MTYASLLRQCTEGRAIDEIVAECAELGVKVNRSTLSQMRTGTRSAPADHAVTRAIAGICGKDPEPLVFAAECERNPAGVLSLIFTVLSGNNPTNEPRTMGELLDRLNALPMVHSQTVSVAIVVNGAQVGSAEIPIAFTVGTAAPK